MNNEFEFEIGDIVTICDGDKIPNYLCGWTASMRGSVGLQARVISKEWGGGYLLTCVNEEDRPRILEYLTYDGRGLVPAFEKFDPASEEDLMGMLGF